MNATPTTPDAYARECINALPLEIRKALFSGLPIGGAIVTTLPNEQVWEIHRESETILRFVPMTKDELVNRLLTEDTIVAFLPWAKP